MEPYYYPLDKFYKSTVGAVSDKDEITFRVKGDFNSVVFLIKKDGNSFYEEHVMSSCEDGFRVTVKFSCGLYFYRFLVDGSVFLGRGEDFYAVKSDNPKDYQLTVYCSDYTVPDWLSGGVIYQIFPDRFYKKQTIKVEDERRVIHENWDDMPIFLPDANGVVQNNDFFGGNLKGIIDKLDYIASLGVNAIYLNPIFKAYSNHRYDTGDYFKIDELLGDEDDFDELIAKADRLNIKIILDGVFNHTGADSVYFNKYGRYNSLGAYQSKSSTYYSWYNFKSFSNEYESWWGINTLPAVNEKSQDFTNFITGIDGVIETYTKKGIGGWRLDVVDELPDFFVKKIREAVKRVNNDAVIIGEVWEDATNKIAYDVRREYFCGKELDAVMNYPLKNAIIDFVTTCRSKNLSYIAREQIDHYPKQSLDSLMNILSTHDTFRLLSAVSGQDVSNADKTVMSKMFIRDDCIAQAKFNLKAASLLQYTMCGVPSLYYGDEVGMQGFSDPLNRRTYPWGNEDEEILSWYRFLGELREYSAFKHGDYKELYADDGLFVFVRTASDSEVLIAVNVSEKTYSLNFDGRLYDLLGKRHFDGERVLRGQSLSVLVNI